MLIEQILDRYDTNNAHLGKLDATQLSNLISEILAELGKPIELTQ